MYLSKQQQYLKNNLDPNNFYDQRKMDEDLEEYKRFQNPEYSHLTSKERIAKKVSEKYNGKYSVKELLRLPKKNLIAINFSINN